MVAVTPAQACGHAVAQIAVAPPAPVVVRTGCGTYELRSDGSVRPYRRNSAPTWAPKAVSHPAPNVWVAHPGGRLAVYRAGRLLWMSSVRHTNDAVVVGGNTIAFELWDSRTPEAMWLARVGGRERFVARGEEPIGWTANGLITQRGNQIRLRSSSGRLLKVLVRGRSPVYDGVDRTVVFVRRGGSVVRTDGFHVWTLRRGFDPLSWVAVLSNRTLQVNERKRTVYLRPTGVVLGSGPATENVIGLPDGSVTYVLQATRTNVVYRLDGRGETHLLYRHRIPRQSCGEYSSVAYANGLILYVDTEGPMAVLDPAGRVAPTDLTRAVLRLQPARTSMRSLGADWAANYN